MIGSLMNVENTAEKLSIPQLQQAMRDGTLPPYIGMPILQQKVQQQKQMQAAQQEQQGIAKAPIAQQILGEAQGLTQPPISAPQQGSQGLSALPSNLPEEYAKGGIIAFASRGEVPDPDYTVTPAQDVGAGLLNIQKPLTQKEIVLAANAKAAERHNIDPELLNNLTRQESNFNPNAKNPDSSASGAHQFTTDTWKDWGTNNPDDRFNPDISADASARYLRSNLDKFGGDVQKALAAYHLGPNSSESKLLGDTDYTNSILNGTPQQQHQQPSYVVPDAPTLNEEPVDFSSLLKPETSAVDYQKQMQERLGDNAGLGAIKNKLSKMEEEGASEKEKAPWMALMTAGLGMMAGTSPFAGVNIGQGGIAGLKAYTEAQDKLNKNEEKRYDLENQLNNAQRAEQMAIWKHGEDSHAADVAGNRTVTLAEKKAQLDKTANLNKEKIDRYKAQLSIPGEQAKTAYYDAAAEATKNKQTNPVNLSDYGGSRNLAMANPTAPQYAKYFVNDSTGKPVFNELAFHTDFTKRDIINKTPIGDLQKIIDADNDPETVELAKAKIKSILSNGQPPSTGGGVTKGWTVTKD